MSKDKKFAIRISEKDLTEIKRKALKAKMTATDYVTICALQKEIVLIDGLTPVLSQLKAIGRNLNQLTTLANMGRINCAYLDETKTLLGNIYEQLSVLMEVNS